MYTKDKTLKDYLIKIDNYPLLTEEQEKHHLLKKKGDICSKEIMIKSNLRLVVKIAKKYKNAVLPLIDLIHEGNIGLMRAVEKFDAIKYKNKFSTYAGYWIRQSIIKSLKNKKRIIRLPLRKENALARITRSQEKFLNLPFSKQIISISNDLSMKPKDVEFYLSLSFQKNISSLDYEDEITPSLYEKTSSKEKTPEEIILKNSLETEIEKVLKKLTSKQKKIIEYRFALNGIEKRLSYKAIGELMNLSPEGVRQIEIRTLKELKNKGKNLEVYLYN